MSVQIPLRPHLGTPHVTPFHQCGGGIKSQRDPVRLFAITAGAWKRAYQVALGNVLLFAVLSWLMLLAVPDSVALAVFPAALYSIGVLLSFLLFIRSGGSFAAVSWFVLGSGIFFGLGTILGGLAPDPRSIHYASTASIIRDLLRVNVLNSSSIVIVLMSAFPFAYRPARVATAAGTPFEIDRMLIRLFPLLATLASASLMLQLLVFPIASNLLVRNVLSSVYLLIPSFLLVYGLLWHRLSSRASTLGGIIVATAVAFSLLTMSKLALMSNLLALAVGVWMYRRTLRSITVGLVALAAIFLLANKLVIDGRNHPSYDAGLNSAAARFAIILDVIDGNAANTSVPAPTQSAESEQLTLSRFSATDVQAYLMDQYDSDQPGQSLRDVWVALVPRLLWPSKPVVTRFGAELHAQFWATPDPTSALAPTYSAEAYWNYGPIGVVLFSIMIGAEVGFFTRRWHLADATGDVAFLMVAFPIALWAAFVESWIAAQYFGGFVTIVAIWYIARFLLLKLFVGGLAATHRPPMPTVRAAML
jgi:hypothetical protein